MGDINNIVKMTITKTAKTPGVDNFGTPALFTTESPLTPFSGGSKLKLYEGASLADDIASDFGSSSEVAKAAALAMSQDKKINKMYVALRDAAVAVIQEAVLSGSLSAAHSISGTVNGTAVTQAWDSDEATTLAALAVKVAAVDGVQTAVAITGGIRVTATLEWELTQSYTVSGSPALTMDVSTVKKVDLVFSGATAAGEAIDGDVNGVAITTVNFTTDDATTLGLLATELQDNFSEISSATAGTNKVTVIGVADTLLELENFTAAGGNNPTINPTVLIEPGWFIANDITARAKENNKWYTFLMTSRLVGAQRSASKKIETLVKLAIFTSSAAGVLAATTTDFAAHINILNYGRSAYIHHADEGIYIDAAWVSRCLAVEPGAGTWARRSLVGVVPDELEPSEIANIESKNANHYTETGEQGDTAKGTVANGDFIDTVRNLDYMYTYLQSGLYSFIKAQEIIYYTQDGINSCIAKLRELLQDMVDQNILASFTTVDIDIANVPQADIDERILKGLDFTGQGTGAIHGLEVNGNVQLP